MQILQTRQVIAFDTEYVDRDFPNVDVVGMSLAWKENGHVDGCYIPVGHTTGESQLPIELVAGAMKPILEDPEKLIVMHNMKADIKASWLMGIYIADAPYWNALLNEGITIPYKKAIRETHLWDTMLASWILEPEREISHKLKKLVKELLGYEMQELTDFAPREKALFTKTGKPVKLKANEVAPDETKVQILKKSKKALLRVDKVPIASLGRYAWDDAVWTYKLYEYFKNIIETSNAGKDNKIFYEVQLPFAVVLTEMEIIGSPIDVALLKDMETRAKAELVTIENRIYELAGKTFNIKSTKQLNEVLFDTLGLKPEGDMNKKGEYCTDKDVMRKYKREYDAFKAGLQKKGAECEIAYWMLKQRELTKLIGTYLEGLVLFAKNGRIHTSFNQLSKDERTGTKTGRLSCVAKDTLLYVKTGRGRGKLQEVEISKLDLTIPTRIMTCEGRYKPINKLIFKGEDDLYEITTTAGWRLVCTKEHQILTPHGWWVSVGGLFVGQEVYGNKHRCTPTNCTGYKRSFITAIRPFGRGEVWDIEVAEDQSYYAGGFLNHNSSNPQMGLLSGDGKLESLLTRWNLSFSPEEYDNTEPSFAGMRRRCNDYLDVI